MEDVGFRTGLNLMPHGRMDGGEKDPSPDASVSPSSGVESLTSYRLDPDIESHCR